MSVHETPRKAPALHPYQVAGVAWLQSLPSDVGGPGGGLLADDPGLGKCAQALCALPVGACMLIVCPKSVSHEWLREIALWRPDLVVVSVDECRARIEEGSCPLLAGEVCVAWPQNLVACNLAAWTQSDPDARHIIITRPSQVTPYTATRSGPRLFVVLDEPHTHRHIRSKWVQVIGSWLRFAVCRWGLDGTPTYNKVSDMWLVLCLLAVAKRFGRERFDRCVKLGTLAAELVASGLMLGRARTQVEGDMHLPPLHSYRLVMPYPGEAPAPVAILRGSGLSCAAVRKTAGMFKARVVAEMWGGQAPWPRLSDSDGLRSQELLPSQVAGPSLAFFVHVAVAKRCFDLCVAVGMRVALVTGSTGDTARARAFAGFQAGTLDKLVLTHCANAGITLTSARSTIIAELPMETKAQAQAVCRMWRMGQTVETTEVLLLWDHWTDEHAAASLQRREDIIVRCGF